MTSARALIIDVDGVLVRGRPDDGCPWATDLEADLGLRADDLHRAFFVPHWEAIVLGRAGLRDRLAPVLATIAPHLSAEQLIAYWFRNDARIDTILLADIAELRRRGVAVHLATNQEHERATYLMQDLGLSRHVDGMHYSAALGCRKPDPAFFRRVAARLRRAPRDLVLVDDSLDNVSAARALGWSAVRWTGEGSLAARLGARLAV